jgi:hypothetical protein
MPETNPRPAEAPATATAVDSSEPGATIGAPGVTARPAAPASPRWGTDIRFMLVALVGVVVLFLAFALLIAFNASGGAITALAVIAAPIATMVAAYYGISLAIRQVDAAKRAATEAEARARAADASARESDAWAAQMESGLRVAVAKLRADGSPTADVERAAGTPDDFF